MKIEKEFKRYITDGVSDEEIMSAIRENYPVQGTEMQEVLDAYFKLRHPQSILRLRKADGLEATFKQGVEKTGDLLERLEIEDISEISNKLGLPVVADITQFATNANNKYGLAFIAEQNRVKILVNGIEISLDTVNYHHALEGPILPIENLIGESYKRLRLYEAEVDSDSSLGLAEEITQHLYDQNLLSGVCVLSKKEIGDIG